jgi:hypothetical protein
MRALAMFRWEVQDERQGYSRFLVACMFGYAFLAISPIPQALGIGGSLWVAVVWVLLLLFILAGGRPIKMWAASAATLSLMLSGLTGLYWMVPGLTLFPLYFVTAIALLAQSTQRELVALVDWASWFVLIVLVGAVAGFAWAYLGLPPLWQFPRPGAEGQLMSVVGPTLTNRWWTELNFIRPSGIYDEPGALSFVTCVVAFFRYSLRKDSRFTWLLLGLGFITFSLAHLVFVAVFLLAQRVNWRGVLTAGALAACVGAGLWYTNVGDLFRTMLLARVTLTETGAIRGDNRSVRMANASAVLVSVPHASIVGAHPDCTFRVEQCKRTFPLMGENPLSELAYRGILISWPYYLFLAFAFLSILRGREGLAFLALGLLFLQRPYVLHLGYSFLAVLAWWLHVRNFRSRPVGDRVVLGSRTEPDRHRAAALAVAAAPS